MPVTAIAVGALAVATRYVYQVVTDPAVLALWWIGLATLSLHVYAHLRADRVRRRPMATGRTVAIVATHEHETTDLHTCIWSILDQRGAVVEEVHVVDVGSTDRPVQPFAHPRIRRHRTRIGGRAATGYILDRLEPDGWDFVLIADGDCVLDQPSDIRTACRRRVEWSASWWRAILPGLTVADRRRPAARRLFGLIQLVIAPLTIGCAFISLAMSERRGTLRWPVITLFAALYLLVRYAATAPYLAGRRRQPWMWLLLTPTAAFWHLVLSVPVKYVALIRLCFRGGAAWQNNGTMSYPESMAPPGSIYYSGYLPDGRES